MRNFLIKLLTVLGGQLSFVLAVVCVFLAFAVLLSAVWLESQTHIFSRLLLLLYVLLEP